MRLSTLVIIAAACILPVPGHAQKGAGGGAATFQELCTPCHGPDGRAQTEMGKKLGAADLTSTEVQQHSDAQFVKQIKEGKGKMPAFGDKLGDDDIRAVVEYIRKFAKQQ